MISVLLNWAYAFVTIYIVGRFILKRIYSFFKYEKEADIYASVATGMAVTTAYAGYFSLFSKVGLLANIILIFVCIIFFIIDRQEYLDNLKTIKNIKPLQLAVFIVIVFIVAFFTMEGELFWDTGLYHCQTIRWIEEYGIVKGLGNLVQRLAYNSTYFCQCALYSFKDICGQSLHTLGGFYSLFTMLYAVFGFKSKKTMPVLRLLPFMYFFIMCSEIVSPASDYPLVNLIIFVTLRWFENIANKEKSEVPYSLLCVYVVFIVSVKLSVGCLVALVILPAILLIKKKKVKDIIAYIILGIIVSAPYFIRNAIISGWLIYPFSGIDIFNFDWKMAKSVVESDANEMCLWGRGAEHGGSLDDPISVWIVSWWKNIPHSQQRFIAASAICVIASIFTGIYRAVLLFIERIKNKSGYYELCNKYSIGYTYYELIITGCLAFWIFKSPGIRYGLTYVLVMTFVVIDDFITNVIFNNEIGKITLKPVDFMSFAGGLIRIGCFATLLLSLYFYVRSTKDYAEWNYECVSNRMKYDSFIMQEDYPVVPCKTAIIDDKLTVYYPEDELGQIWYDMFPAVWYHDVSGVEMRGESIKDGFRGRH